MKKLTLAATMITSIVGCYAHADTIRIATWNIEQLRAMEGIGAVKRETADFDALARYATELDADIVALQEVDGPEAAARVFDPLDYDFFFSDRNNVQRTGFAIRKGITVTEDRDFVDLDLGGSVRRGTDVTVDIAGQSLRLMSVHLKSGCFEKPLTTNSNACNKLEDQLPILEDWIDKRTSDGVPFVVLGDFNRRFDVESGSLDEVFFNQIDDGDPAPLDLIRVPPPGARSDCSEGAFPVFIDHFVLDEQAEKLLVPGSFEQLVFTPQDEDDFILSDHCPLSISMTILDDDAPSVAERAEELFAEIRALVNETNAKVEELHELIPMLKEE